MPIHRIGSKTILFIHVPKTAGMAMGAHLGQAGRTAFEDRIAFRGGTFGPRHQPAAVLEKIFLPEMIDYAFMVVRHPVARLVSEYRYQRRHGWIQLSRLRILGFDAWLRYAFFRLRSDPNWRVGHFRPQVKYECFNCEVFRYEEGLGKVSRRISDLTKAAIPDTLPPTNVSVPRPVRISQASMDLIADYYAADFIRFDYQVEVPQLQGVTKV
jgi:hypothetical protein